MKKTIISLGKPLLLLFALLFGTGVQGQTGQIMTLLEYPGCDTSIVRDWKEGLSVIYSKTPTGSWFHLVDCNGATVSSVATGDNVKDMEVEKDTAYYCGVDASGSPVVGYFTIPDLLSGTLHGTEVTFSSPSSVISMTVMPRRLEVFHVTDGVHVILLCDVRYASDSVKRVVADMRRENLTGIWGISFGAYSWSDRDNVFYCDDIAVTDNYIVLVGHKRHSAGIHLRKFERPLSAAYDIFATSSVVYNELYDYWPFGGNITVLGDAFGEHPVWCTHTVGDEIAIACMASYMDGTGVATYGYTVKKIGVSTMTIQGELFVPFSTVLDPKWTVRDIRYDVTGGEILVLHDATDIDGIIKSMIAVVDRAVFTSVEEYLPNVLIYQHSMDMFSQWVGGVTSCGSRVGGVQFDWCVGKPATHSCFSLNGVGSMPWAQTIRSMTIGVTPQFGQCLPTDSSQPVEITPMEIKCTEWNKNNKGE